MFVKGKARLGKMCNQKTATCVALVDVNENDKPSFDTTVKKALENFNNNAELMKDSEPVLGHKARMRKK